MGSTAVCVLAAVLLAITFVTTDAALRPDVQARINCTLGECADLRARWNETQNSDDFRAYLNCTKECVEKLVGSGPFERPPLERPPMWHRPRGPPPQFGSRFPYGQHHQPYGRRPSFGMPPPPPPPPEEEGEEGGEEGENEYVAVE